MPTRREFLGAIAVPAASVVTMPAFPRAMRAIAEACAAVDDAARPAVEVAEDEDFWGVIQRAFTVDRALINLNNGGVSPAPEWVQTAMKRRLDRSNEAPTHTMWRQLEPERETVRARLARTFGCETEEIAITRNASEGLQICQFGFDLVPGDVVLTTNQDYPRMLATFRQRTRRDRIELVEISLPTPAEDDDEVVRRFEQAIVEHRPRLLLMCHMINLTGQILPVRRVVEMARRYDVPVIVDGAHSFAHFAFDLAALDCDYFATSLHKWLFAPHGTGMLFVRRDRIGSLWPLMAADESLTDDIRKFEEIGTHPAANALAIAEALTFHENIGAERKEARLVRLRDRWARRLLEHDRVRLHTSLVPGKACGIATVEVDGIPVPDLVAHLWREHKIITTGIQHEEFSGVRVSPSVYTTLEEIDRFADAVEAVIEHGLPS